MQPLMDRAVQVASDKALMPAIRATSTRLAERLSEEFKVALSKMRAELSHDNEANSELVQALARSLSELKNEVAVLSEQLARAQPVSPPAPTPVLPRETPKSKWEDLFLATLHDTSEDAIVKLVTNNWKDTDVIFPQPESGLPSPVSQPVILTIIHRVSGSKGFADGSLLSPGPVSSLQGQCGCKCGRGTSERSSISM